MEDFRTMVKDALFNKDNLVRQASEKRVQDFCTQSPTQFLEFSTFELANESATPDLRQGCGTLLIRAIRLPVFFFNLLGLSAFLGQTRSPYVVRYR